MIINVNVDYVKSDLYSYKFLAGFTYEVTNETSFADLFKHLIDIGEKNLNEGKESVRAHKCRFGQWLDSKNINGLDDRKIANEQYFVFHNKNYKDEYFRIRVYHVQPI